MADPSPTTSSPRPFDNHDAHPNDGAAAKESHDEPHTELIMTHDEYENVGAVRPMGEINWDCPCLQGMAHGPCGPAFRTAFSCFVKSASEPKGVECAGSFSTMQDCFRSHPEDYPMASAASDENDEGNSDNEENDDNDGKEENEKEKDKNDYDNEIENSGHHVKESNRSLSGRVEGSKLDLEPSPAA